MAKGNSTIMFSSAGDPPQVVSILAAVRNEALYLEEMITSIKSQTLGSWELLIVDDASDDETAKIAARHAESDGRIRLISRGRKLGKAAAYNLAFRSSVGDVVVLLAGDDRLPDTSLEVRAAAVRSAAPAKRVAACFRLRTFSSQRSMDGLVLPRVGASRSGGVMALSRDLARVVFPIDERLISEDLWMAEVVQVYADVIIERPEVVLEYRIHEGNSNPRAKPFEEMSTAMALRHEAWRLVLEKFRDELQESHRRRLQLMHDAELLRRAGRPLGIIFHIRGLPLPDRLAMVSMSRKSIFRVRQRFYRILAGRRRG